MISEVNLINEVAVLKLQGSLEISIHKDLKDQLLKTASEYEDDMVLDFSEVTFIDSSCLGAIVSVTKELRNQKGNVKIVNLTDDVYSIFQITRLDKVFQIYDDINQAVESYFK